MDQCAELGVSADTTNNLKTRLGNIGKTRIIFSISRHSRSVLLNKELLVCNVNVYYCTYEAGIQSVACAHTSTLRLHVYVNVYTTT